MATIKNLDVTITFKVGLGVIDIPDTVKYALIHAEQEDRSIDHESDEEASEWLGRFIEVRDSYSWKCEVNAID